MTDHKVVGREQWEATRDELLKREKEHTDALLDAQTSAA